jgi:hypothetical protein
MADELLRLPDTMRDARTDAYSRQSGTFDVRGG